MSFTIDSQNQNRMSLLDIQIIREDEAFTTSVYHKPTFSVEFIHILTPFYHLPIPFVLPTKSLTNSFEFGQVRLNYTMN